MNSSRSIHDIMRFFDYDHLPEHLQAISKPFHDLAHDCVRSETHDLDQLHMGLMDLLRAKDCMVRAGIKPKVDLMGIREMTPDNRPKSTLLWVIGRVCEGGYIESNRPIHFSTLADIIGKAGLYVTDKDVRSALEVAGCVIMDSERVDGGVLMEFLENLGIRVTPERSKVDREFSDDGVMVNDRHGISTH